MHCQVLFVTKRTSVFFFLDQCMIKTITLRSVISLSPPNNFTNRVITLELYNLISMNTSSKSNESE